MKLGARLQAAIEIFDEISLRGRGASVALADWGRSHRYAGSGDRAAIGNLVYDALRKKQSLAYTMGDEKSRSIVLAALRYEWRLDADEIAALCDGSSFGPAPLNAAELASLHTRDLSAAPPWVQGDYPEWLHPSFSAVFGDDAIAEVAALTKRAPVDLRVNTLKATRDKVIKAFAKHGAEPTSISPLGVRLPPRERDGRTPNVEADPAHGKGWFEVQDEGSQIAALLAGVGPRQQVADICAGAGGKTLAFAAAMQNTGQIYAYDADATRFRPIFERLKRAGARNVQTLQPGQDSALSELDARMDVVVIDAPCSGTGVWRRRPDAKWRLTAAHLTERIAVQSQLLKIGSSLVRPGGALIYVTCSVLREENSEQIRDFLAASPDFARGDILTQAEAALTSMPVQPWTIPPQELLLTPNKHNTDGFFVASLVRGVE